MFLGFGLIPKAYTSANRKTVILDELVHAKSNITHVDMRDVKCVSESEVKYGQVVANKKDAENIPSKVINAHEKMIQAIYKKGRTKGYDLKPDTNYSICKRWLSLKKFNDDLSKLPLYSEFIKSENSDYITSLHVYGSNAYTPETLCIINRYLVPSYIANLLFKVEFNDTVKHFVTINEVAEYVDYGQSTVSGWKGIHGIGNRFEISGGHVTIVKGNYRISGDQLRTPSEYT